MNHGSGGGGGTSAQGPGQAGGQQAIVLTQEQSQQLLERLKQNNALQTQINPRTGQKQLFIKQLSNASGEKIVIPMSSGIMTGVTVPTAPNITLSPIKQQPGTSTLQSLPQTRRTIKIGSPSTSVTSNGQLIRTQHPSQLAVHNTQFSAAVTPNKSISLLGTASPAATPTFSSPSTQIDSSLSRSNKTSEVDFETFSDSKRRKTDKDRKGLRHFSMKVCEKVKAKGFTSYNEVAEELVAELTDPRCNSPSDDQKNIKRRVYDALNVLMAMNIISKEKKEIRWLGLPTNSVQEAYSLESEKTKRIKDKTRQLQDLIIQQIAFKNLVERNKELERNLGEPTPNSSIQLPFIIVSTKKDTTVDVQINNDKSEWLFDFNDLFETNDDMEVLRRMDMDLGLERGQVTEADLARAKAMVPRALEPYVVQLAQHGKGSCALPIVSEPITEVNVNVKEDPGDDDDIEED